MEESSETRTSLTLDKGGNQSEYSGLIKTSTSHDAIQNPSAFTKVAKKSRQSVPASSHFVFSQSSPYREMVVESLTEEGDEASKMDRNAIGSPLTRAAVCNGSDGKLISSGSDSAGVSMHAIPSSFNLLSDVDTSSFENITMATSTQTTCEILGSDTAAHTTTAQAPAGSHSARQNPGRPDETHSPADETGFR
eukprot:scpid98942/ scgid8995/ 